MAEFSIKTIGKDSFEEIRIMKEKEISKIYKNIQINIVQNFWMDGSVELCELNLDFCANTLRCQKFFLQFSQKDSVVQRNHDSFSFRTTLIRINVNRVIKSSLN